MKINIKIYCLCVISSLFITSCYKDLGNSDYVNINDVTISDIGQKEVKSGEILEISPVVETRFSDETNLTYHWEIVGNKVAEGKDLKYTVNLKAGSYMGTFVVTDTSLGVEYLKKFTLNVNTGVGWVVLTESNGIGNISFVQTSDGVVLRDWYNKINGKSLGAGPRKLLFHKTKRANDKGEFLKLLSIVCEGGPDYMVTLNDFSQISSCREEFTSIPLDFQPVNYVVGLRSDWMISNGKLFFRNYASTDIEIPQFSSIPREVKGDYNLADEMYPTSRLSAMNIIMYDQLNHRFLKSNYSKLTIISDANKNAPFDVNDIKHEYVYFAPRGPVVNKYNFLGIFKDSDLKEHYLYYFTMKWGAMFNSQRMVKMNDGGLVLPESVIEVGKVREMLFFTNGNCVYRYNYKNNSLPVLVREFDHPITSLKLAGNDNLLVCGENSPSGGNLYVVRVNYKNFGEVSKTFLNVGGKPIQTVFKGK